jgi:hypothetical protein
MPRPHKDFTKSNSGADAEKTPAADSALQMKEKERRNNGGITPPLH